MTPPSPPRHGGPGLDAEGGPGFNADHQAVPLAEWLAKALPSSCPEIRRFAEGIRQDEAAVRAALRRLEEEILRDHVGHCVERAVASGSRADQRRKIEELMAVVSRSGR